MTMAYDTRLDLRVAIKVISPEFSCTLEASRFDSVLKRFESEAKIAAKIDHANVILYHSITLITARVISSSCFAEARNSCTASMIASRILSAEV